MKKEFIDFINALMNAAPDVAEQLMSDNVKKYLETLTDGSKDKPELTDNGKLVLKYMQDHLDTAAWKAREIADGLFVSSRNVSGAMRKLVTDGFVEKLGQDPVIYAITEKGKNYIIEE